VGEGVHVDTGLGDGARGRAGLGEITIGSPRCGAAEAASANFDENSPKVRCWLRSSMSPKVAASQNTVVPPLPSMTS
jgi:hypothetical protein